MAKDIRDVQAQLTPEEREEQRKQKYDAEATLLIIAMRDTMTRLLNSLDQWNAQKKALEAGRTLEDAHFDDLPFTRDQWGSAVVTVDGINNLLDAEGRYGALNVVSHPQSRSIK